MSNDNSLKVLQEYAPFNYTLLTEASGAPGTSKLMLKGILQKADVLNQNGRIYPRKILEKEISNYQKFIKENRALGELDHPDTSVVELKNTSHIIREAYMDDKGVVWGSIEVLPTHAGQNLAALVTAGVTVGISSRGVGSTKNEGGRTVVQEDFQLICWDIVSEPSTPGAFLMREGRQVTKSELDQLNEKRFTRDVRIDRILTDIVMWGK
jgi:hypothetical protein